MKGTREDKLRLHNSDPIFKETEYSVATGSLCASGASCRRRVSICSFMLELYGTSAASRSSPYASIWSLDAAVTKSPSLPTSFVSSFLLHHVNGAYVRYPTMFVCIRLVCSEHEFLEERRCESGVACKRACAPYIPARRASAPQVFLSTPLHGIDTPHKKNLRNHVSFHLSLFFHSSLLMMRFDVLWSLFSSLGESLRVLVARGLHMVQAPAYLTTEIREAKFSGACVANSLRHVM